MIDRPARVVAQLYGQAGPSISRPVSANPPADLPWQICKTHETPDALIASLCEAVRPVGRASLARIKGDRLGRTLGMPIANRLCPDENLLRQNAAI
ncbi:hypothetical protein EHI42_27775 [Rhizobium hidalgonense]|nr:hypothetical protein EHI42_27775 [Rhizobium hidalgonense]